MPTPTNVNPEATQVGLTGSNTGNEYLIDPDTGQPYDAAHPLPVDVARVNGAALSYSNPDITQDQVRAATIAGKHWHATTGLLTSGATNFRGAQIFNPAGSGVILYVYSSIPLNNSANAHTYRKITQNANGNLTGWTDAAMTSANMDFGVSASPLAVVSSTSTDFTSANLTTFGGTDFELIGTQNNVAIEAVTNGKFIRIPEGKGLLFVLKQGAANNWGMTWGWLEY